MVHSLSVLWILDYETTDLEHLLITQVNRVSLNVLRFSQNWILLILFNKFYKFPIDIQSNLLMSKNLPNIWVINIFKILP